MRFGFDCLTFLFLQIFRPLLRTCYYIYAANVKDH